MKRLILAFLLMGGSARAETLDSLLNAVRMVLLDRGSPVAFNDSVYVYHARDALQRVGLASMAIVVDTTIALTENTQLYTLNRRLIRPRVAYWQTAGQRGHVPFIPGKDVWKKSLDDQMAYSTGPGKKVYITRKLSLEHNLYLQFVTEPTALPKDSATQIDCPQGLLPALHKETAAGMLAATRVQANVVTAQQLRAEANEVISFYLFAYEGMVADTAAFPR